MEEFDSLYLIKNSFYLGEYDKCLKEAEELSLNEGDTFNIEKKTFIMIRALLLKRDFERMKKIFNALTPDYRNFILHTSVFMQYFSQKKLDEEFIKSALEYFQREPNSRFNPEHYILVVVCAYIFFAERQFDPFFFLVHQTKDLDLLALKFVALIQINRYDLANQTLLEMKNIDDESTIMYIVTSWSQLIKEQNADALSSLNEFAQKYEYSETILNLMAIVLVQQNNFETALKVYDQALTSLKLEENYAKYKDDAIVGSILANKIRLTKMMALSEKVEEEVTKYEELLKKVDGKNEYFVLNKTSNHLFDQAIASISK